MPLKLACINIERSKHLDRVQAFLHAQQPDVLCLQELCERDIPLFEKLFGQTLVFVPMTQHPAEQESHPMGIAIIAPTPLENPEVTYYFGQSGLVPTIGFCQTNGEFDVDPTTIHKALISATVKGLRIGTTHLTWTQHGQSTPRQLADARSLISLAQQQAQRAGGYTLCGDFNAPRGRPTFSLLAEHFTDAIPPHYTTSIDGTLHRAGPLNLMVDAIFHTPEIKAEKVTFHTGVSDHCALTATLSAV